MFISDLFEAQAKQTLVLIPGGFHPFHPGHLSLYRSAERAFPGATIVYVATDDRKDRPFPFVEKQKLAQIAGVTPQHFQLVRSPFVAKEVTDNFDPNNTVLVFARSEKDRDEYPKAGGVKKDGSPSYLQPYVKGKLAPMSQHGYMAYLPVVQFDAGPSGVTSATQIRNMWPQADDAQKNDIVTDLYPKNPQAAKQILDQYLGGAVAEGKNNELDSLYNQYDELDYDGNSESDREQMRFIQQKIRDLKAKQGVAEGAPIVVMPSPERLKKAEPKKVDLSKIGTPAKPPSTEKRGVKGRPGQRPMPDQGVAEGATGTPPKFLGYILSNSQGKFSDIEEIEDLFDYAYLSDLDLLTIADGADEEGISALKWMTPRMAWLLKNINDKSYLPVIKPLAVAWMKTVAPAIDKYVKDVLNDLDEGLNEDEYDEYENDQLSQEDAVSKMFTRLAKQGRDPLDRISHRFGWSSYELDELAQMQGFDDSAQWLNSFNQGVAEGSNNNDDEPPYHARILDKKTKKVIADEGPYEWEDGAVDRCEAYLAWARTKGMDIVAQVYQPANGKNYVTWQVPDEGNYDLEEQGVAEGTLNEDIIGPNNKGEYYIIDSKEGEPDHKVAGPFSTWEEAIAANKQRNRKVRQSEQGVAEGDDRGDYHATARAANQASRTAKSSQGHAKAADLHDRAATYGLSAGQDQSVIRDHQMAAWEHNRASKKMKEGVAEGNNNNDVATWAVRVVAHNTQFDTLAKTIKVKTNDFDSIGSIIREKLGKKGYTVTHIGNPVAISVTEGIFDRFKKKPAQPEVADPGNYPRIGSDIAQWMADTVEYHKSKFPDSVWKLFCPTYPDYLPVRVRVGTSEKIMQQNMDAYIHLRDQNPEAVRVARQKFDKNNTYPSGPRDDYTNKEKAQGIREDIEQIDQQLTLLRQFKAK